MTRLVLVAASTPARGLTIGVFLAVLAVTLGITFWAARGRGGGDEDQTSHHASSSSGSTWDALSRRTSSAMRRSGPSDNRR